MKRRSRLPSEWATWNSPPAPPILGGSSPWPPSLGERIPDCGRGAKSQSFPKFGGWGALLRTAGLTAASLALCMACTAQPPSAKKNAYEPQAIQVLQGMADAYSHLTSLRQETEFVSAITPLIPLPVDKSIPEEPDGSETGALKRGGPKDALHSDRKLDKKLRLAFASPNKLRLEVEDADENGKLHVSYWVSDGKTFWTYNPAKNLFSREKAPGKIRDFARLTHMTSGSLEILMLMGVNPFAHVEEQTEGVRYAGKENVRGVVTDVIAMTADLGATGTETRLYIGAEDHLLYRLVSETTQKALPPKHVGVGSPLDELAPPEPSSQPIPGNPEDLPSLPGVLMKSRVTYDNKIDLDPKFDSSAFVYQPPADALYLTNPVQDKPMTLKQRIAELSRNARKQHKAPPKVIRF